MLHRWKMDIVITRCMGGEGSRKSEVGSWKSEVGSWKLEVGSRKSEVGSWKSEVAAIEGSAIIT